MARTNFKAKCEEYFFVDKQKAMDKLTELELNKIKLYEEVFVKWLDDPAMSEPDIVNILMNNHGLSRSQAYRDCFEIKYLLGNVNEAAKEFQRYRANLMLTSGYKMAKDATDKLDIQRAEVMIRAGKAMADVNRLNKMEAEELPYDQIVPPALEPVYDPTLIGESKPIGVLQIEINKMRKEFGDIPDAEIVKDDG